MPTSKDGILRAARANLAWEKPTWSLRERLSRTADGAPRWLGVSKSPSKEPSDSHGELALARHSGCGLGGGRLVLAER